MNLLFLILINLFGKDIKLWHKIACTIQIRILIKNPINVEYKLLKLIQV